MAPDPSSGTRTLAGESASCLDWQDYGSDVSEPLRNGRDSSGTGRLPVVPEAVTYAPLAFDEHKIEFTQLAEWIDCKALD